MSKIAVWKTGHPIADTVAEHLARGFNAEIYQTSDASEEKIGQTQAHIGYGILRETGRVFALAGAAKKDWFNVDRGYFAPEHFSGYYRISYKGTQAKWHDDIPQQDIDFKLEHWKSGGKYILVCPPSEAVCDFFKEPSWMNRALLDIYPFKGLEFVEYRVRTKGAEWSIEWDEIIAVITFNSSIGWQALQRGVPAFSDPVHSIVGSYYASKLKNPLDFLSEEYKRVDREPLFRAMRAHQFTLAEFAEGKAWALIQHYLTTQTKSQQNELRSNQL